MASRYDTPGAGPADPKFHVGALALCPWCDKAFHTGTYAAEDGRYGFYVMKRWQDLTAAEKCAEMGHDFVKGVCGSCGVIKPSE